jgi:hypothetical protein
MTDMEKPGSFNEESDHIRQNMHRIETRPNGKGRTLKVDIPISKGCFINDARFKPESLAVFPLEEMLLPPMCLIWDINLPSGHSSFGLTTLLDNFSVSTTQTPIRIFC